MIREEVGKIRQLLSTLTSKHRRFADKEWRQHAMRVKPAKFVDDSSAPDSAPLWGATPCRAQGRACARRAAKRAPSEPWRGAAAREPAAAAGQASGLPRRGRQSRAGSLGATLAAQPLQARRAFEGLSVVTRQPVS